MEQCYSGGFVDSVISSSTAGCTSIATAVDATTSSDGGADFDPFAFAWIGALAGANPDGSSLATPPVPSGCVSANAAFQYASSNDSGKDDNPQFQQNTPCGGAVCLTEDRVSVQVPQNFRFLVPQAAMAEMAHQAFAKNLGQQRGEDLHREIISSLATAHGTFLDSLRKPPDAKP